MKLKIIIIIVMAPVCLKGYPQFSNDVGLSPGVEFLAQITSHLQDRATEKVYSQLNFSPGWYYQQNLKGKSIAEIGIRFIQVRNEYSFFIPSPPNSAFNVILKGKEKFLSGWVLYNVTTQYLDLSFGPSADYFLEWQETSSNNGLAVYQKQLPRQFFPDRWSFGLLFKAAKPIPIDKKLWLAPCIYYNPLFSGRKNFFGLSCSAQYAL